MTKTAETIAASMKLFNAINSHSTEMLKTLARELNLRTDKDAILVASMIDSILEERMPEAEFLGFMEELESELIAA